MGGFVAWLYGSKVTRKQTLLSWAVLPLTRHHPTPAIIAGARAKTIFENLWFKVNKSNKYRIGGSEATLFAYARGAVTRTDLFEFAWKEAPFFSLPSVPVVGRLQLRPRLGVTDLIPDILISEPQNSDRRNLEACAWTLSFYAKSSSAQGSGEGLVNIHCVLLVSSGWWDDD